MMKNKFTRIHLELFYLVKQFLKYRERFVSEGDLNAMKRMNDSCDKMRDYIEEAELLTEGI